MTQNERERVEKHFEELHSKATGITTNIPDDIRYALKASYLAGADYAVDMFAPHWISVEDELPQYGDEQELLAVYNGMACIVFYNTLEDILKDIKTFGLTHWMPLPELPSSSEKPNNYKKGGEQ